MARADRMEAEILDERGSRGRGAPVCPGLALVRDGNGPRAFETLLRYRGALLAELLRSLKALKALQAEAAKARRLEAKGATAPEAEPAPVLVFQSRRTREAAAAPASPRPDRSAPATPASTGQANAAARPNEPERRGNPTFEPSGTGHQPASRASMTSQCRRRPAGRSKVVGGASIT